MAKDNVNKDISNALKNARRGYTPIKGAKDTRVAEHTTIYTNTSLWTVTRSGEQVYSNKLKRLKTPEDYKEEQKKEAEKAKAKAKENAKLTKEYDALVKKASKSGDWTQADAFKKEHSDLAAAYWKEGNGAQMAANEKYKEQKEKLTKEAKEAEKSFKTKEAQERKEVINQYKSYREARKELEKQIKEDEKKAVKELKKESLGMIPNVDGVVVNTAAVIDAQVKDYHCSILGSCISEQTSTPEDILNISSDFNVSSEGATNSGITLSSINEKREKLQKLEAEMMGNIAQYSEHLAPYKAAAEEARDKKQALENPNPSKFLTAMNKVQAGVGSASGKVLETAEGLVKWFEEQEAIIDALPTMSEPGKDVYIVEFRENYKPNGETDAVSDWFYTGETAPMDREYNQRIQEMKRNVCAFLTKHVEEVNEFINKRLEEATKKCKQCQIFINIITLIKKLPSLTTIIKWAKSIIDSFIEVYKMIYCTFKSVMQVIELVLIRGPQLINKIMKKMTEFDCSVNFSIDVNTKSGK